MYNGIWERNDNALLLPLTIWMNLSTQQTHFAPRPPKITSLASCVLLEPVPSILCPIIWTWLLPRSQYLYLPKSKFAVSYLLVPELSTALAMVCTPSSVKQPLDSRILPLPSLPLACWLASGLLLFCPVSWVFLHQNCKCALGLYSRWPFSSSYLTSLQRCSIQVSGLNSIYKPIFPIFVFCWPSPWTLDFSCEL